MNESRTVIFVSLAIYAALCLAVGIFTLKRTRSSHDFFMAGRTLGVLVTAAAIFSSTVSGFAFVGGPGLIYKLGTSSLWITITATSGAALTFLLVAKKLRVFSELRDPVSLPDAIAVRYGSRTSQGLAALVILLGVLGYLATQIRAMATVFAILLKNTGGESLGIGFCVALSYGILVTYCVAGGIVASVYTDVLQGLIMIVGTVAVLITVASSFDGGLQKAGEILVGDNADSWGAFGTLGVFGCLSWYFLFSLGMCGQPHIVTKLMMARRIDDLPRILLLSVTAGTLASVLWIAVGFAMRAHVVAGDIPPLNDPDSASPTFLLLYAHPIVAGLVFAGLFSAIMSTADSFLNVGAAALVHDLPAAFANRTLRHELAYARMATILIAGVAALIAFTWQDLLGFLGAFGWATFASALVPVVAIGFNWRRATATAAHVTLVFALIAQLICWLTGLRLPLGVDPGAATLLASITVFLLVSLCTSPKPLPPDMDVVLEI